MIYILSTAAGVALLSYLLIGMWIRYLRRQQYMDIPNHRSLHQSSVPSGGGAVIILLIVIAGVVLAMLSARWQLFGSLCFLLSCWAALGWWDDRKPMGAGLRFIIQLILVLLAILAYGYVDSVSITNQFSMHLGVIGAAITLFGAVWFINLYNFMDGMDGLAASQTIVASITLAIWLWWYGDQTLAMLCIVMAASSYGFIIWNWHPAKLFLGDVGSLSVAAFFVMLLIFTVSQYGFPVMPFLLLFGVFIADATATLIRRFCLGEKVWQAHKSHFYQRLAVLGVQHTKITLAYLIMIVLCAILASLTKQNPNWIIGALLIEIASFVLGALYVQRREKNTIKQ